ncbi:hypothetical protein J7U46_08795 [Pelomonas sp. V22]|uniref:hypothetical protein n=1 Tax=Pelomonas sp. V22 TaxID=2822139 RepID=UPI0024A97ED1|nr:hypothetical protein [Pelomonas sp. V22]MDI4633141.1 hypothetical protein [Pelomonas sp. V22]
MSLGKIADVSKLQAARAANIDLWSPVVFAALQRLKSGPATEDLEALLLDRQFNVIAHQAIWAVTEISADVRWKYCAQRYFSADTLARWKKLESSGIPKMSQFVPGLRHEHVVERAELKSMLESATSPEGVAAILEKAESCVVTAEEDRRLNKSHQGWDRYRLAKTAPVRVWDRLKLCWR